MKNSEKLRLAGSVLWSGIPDEFSGDKFRFICHALETTVGTGPALELRAWIRSIMGGEATYESWLVNVAGIEAHWKHDEIKLQESRKRWLDWMITYWEEQGE